MQKKRLRGTSPPGRLAAEQKAQTNGVYLFCRASLTHPALGFPPSDVSVLLIFLRLLFFPGVALLSHLLRPWQDFEFDWHPYRLFPCVQQNSNTKKMFVSVRHRGELLKVSYHSSGFVLLIIEPMHISHFECSIPDSVGSSLWYTVHY